MVSLTSSGRQPLGFAQPWPERLTFTCDLPRLKNGGVAVVRKWIEEAEQPRLIIIDTLAKVRDVKGQQESTYEADYQSVSDLTVLLALTCEKPNSFRAR